MAPEQVAGRFHILTPAADLYSLGAVLYHMLTGFIVAYQVHRLTILGPSPVSRSSS